MRLDAIAILVALIATGSLALYAGGAWLRAKARGRSLTVPRHVALYSLIATVAIILFATILFTLTAGGIQPDLRSLSLQPLDWLRVLDTPEGMRGLIEFGYNILMFVPIGLLLPVVFRPLRKLFRVLIVVAVAVLIIEVTQHFIGRTADIDDVIANLLGSVIGYGLYLWLHGRYSHTRWFVAFQGDDEPRARGADSE